MGDVSVNAHCAVDWELFGTNLNSLVIPYQGSFVVMLRHQLRLDDVTMALSSLAWCPGIRSVFDTARVTEKGF